MALSVTLSRPAAFMAFAISDLARAVLRGVRTWQEQEQEQEKEKDKELEKVRNKSDCIWYLQLLFSLLFSTYTATLVLGLTGINTGNSFFLKRKEILFVSLGLSC